MIGRTPAASQRAVNFLLRVRGSIGVPKRPVKTSDGMSFVCGQVLGLAPSAAAAAVLAKHTGIRADHSPNSPGPLQHSDLPDWRERSTRRPW